MIFLFIYFFGGGAVEDVWDYVIQITSFWPHFVCTFYATLSIIITYHIASYLCCKRSYGSV